MYVDIDVILCIRYYNILQEQLGYDLHRIVGDNHTVEYRYDYMTDIITDEAASIISSHNTDKPMYLQLAHLAAHSSSSEDVMEVRDWRETNATLGYIKDLSRRKYASEYNSISLLSVGVVSSTRRIWILREIRSFT